MALGSAEIDRRGIERLSRLAQQLDAELEALFVEDRDLLELVDLPFLREFRFASMRLEGLHAERLQEELRSAAQRAERLLEQHAALRTIPWHFRTWRGSLEQELLSAVDADVIALAGLGARTPGVGEASRPGGVTVALCYGGGDCAQRALTMASQLASQTSAELLLLLPAASTPAQDQALREALEMQLAVLPAPTHGARIEVLGEATPEALARHLHGVVAPLLVLPRDAELLHAGSLRDLLERARCELFIVS